MTLKKWLTATFALMLVVVLVGTAIPAAQAAPPRQDDAGTRTITVTGIGTAYGAPDMVMLGLGVEAVNTDIQAAMDDTTTRMGAVMQALQDNGVAREDIRTEHFSIYQDYSGPMGPEAQGAEPRYRVSNGVRATVRNVDQVLSLIHI